MTHIQSCAKKHAFDGGTVNLLIQKEISPEDPFVKNTFLEDVLVDAASKQKTKRRKQGESSLKTVSISRGSSVPRTPTPDSSPKLLSLRNLTIHSPTPTLKSKKAHKALAKSRLDSDGLTSSSERSAPKKKKGPSKKTPSKITRPFGKKWQLHMMHNITLDSDLHLRILRYEPIHFEVFLEIATRYAPPSGKLKLHLRTFLDNQAIIFYG